MDLAERRKYYNTCKYDGKIEPGDSRNLDIDRFGERPVRGVNWVERLASPVELSDEPLLLLFTGLRGSGKSTELARLAARLEKPAGAHLLTVTVDAEDVLDVTSEIDIPDIIATIVSETERRVRLVEDRSPEHALRDGYITRLWDWLTRTDVSLASMQVGIPSGPSFVADMKTNPAFRQKVRSIITSRLPAFLSEARKEMVTLNDRAIQQGYRGLMVIYDSLEKLRGTTSNYTEVLNSAERIFASSAPYLQLPVHVLYTVPPALVTRRIEHVEFMPMIKLHERGPERRPWEPGFAAARELIRCRVPDEALGELLGPSFEDRLRQLIVWTGGYPREIVRLLRRIIELNEFPTSDSSFRRIWDELQDEYRKVILEDAFEWLARVAAERYLVLPSEEHRQVADLMLNNNVIMRYLNEQDWFDLHPAVCNLPMLKAACRASEKSGASPPAPQS
ncbi:hypothetical protein FJY70_05450 [candidate division WOR-3 bacterium]|nr:hypothetical protein [candidate division WOR-3 bacterium]